MITEREGMTFGSRRLPRFLRSLAPGKGIRDVKSQLRRIESKIDLLEHFSNGGRSTYVGNNRVLVKAVVHGVHIMYFVEADDRLLSPWFITTGDYETHIKDFFVRNAKPDSHCIDVGSNFGFFACLMGKFCPDGRVIAVEPTENAFQLVRDNLAINACVHASAMQAAVSDRAGELTLYRRTNRSGNSSIAAAPEDVTTFFGEPPVQPFTVPSVRVDDLVESLGGRLDLMKIDVEGAEPLVFAGARQAISENPQLLIVMEWSPGQIQSAGFDIPTFLADLEAMNLAAYDIDGQNLVNLPVRSLSTMSYRSGIVLKRAG